MHIYILNKIKKIVKHNFFDKIITKKEAKKVSPTIKQEDLYNSLLNLGDIIKQRRYQ